MKQFTIIFQIVVILAFVLAGISADKKSCKYAKFTPDHSFCKERNPKCKITGTGLNDKQKKLIVKMHNDYRSQIAQGKEKRANGMPSAANMLEMEWDEELAKIAQKHVEQCKQGHDCPDCRKVDRFDVGQNLYYNMATKKKSKEEGIKSGIKSWYEEVKIFNKKMVSSFKSGDWGHLTQLIWAKSYKVGCGFVDYEEGDSYKQTFGCNYGPAGNFLNQPVYKEGKPASDCPAKSSIEGLCHAKGQGRSGIQKKEAEGRRQTLEERIKSMRATLLALRSSIATVKTWIQESKETS